MLMDYTRLGLNKENRVRDMVSSGIPSLTKFASQINVSRKTLDAWAEKNKTFALAMQEARDRISDIIADAAALKLLDSSFSKFLLTTQFGYTDKGEESEDQGPFELNLTVVK